MSHNLKIEVPHGPKGARIRMALVEKMPAGSNLEDRQVSEHVLELDASPVKKKTHSFSVSVPHGHYLVCEPLAPEDK